MQQFFVSVTSGLDTMAQDTKFEAKQSGVTVALSSAVVSAVQEAANTGETLSNAASNTSSSRMQGLAGAAGALAAYNTYNKVSDILKDPNQVTGVSVSVSLGSSQSSGSSHDESTTAVGSQVVSAGSVNVTARNPKPNPDGTTAPATANAGNIVIEGSQVIATKDINLNADRNIDLLAAGNTSEHSSQNQSSSASVGVGFALGGTQNGFTINASASRANGQANGESQSSTNTHVQAGGTLTFNSGGDTTLQGATASGNKVTGTVGGDLILTSLQDTNTYSEKQSSAGVGVSLCIPPICAGASSVNVSVSKTNINSNYQSVGEQTAIRAGDGGFDIDVQGTTTLTGAQITSTDKAVQGGKNSFTSAGGIDMQDLQNSAQFDADSFSVSATVRGDSRNEDGTPKLDTAGKPIQGKPEGSFGFGSDSGQASSTSTSGISGIAGDTKARTGDKETGLKPLFDAAKTKAEVQSQVAITAEFGKNASKAWGDYATNKENELRSLGKHEEADKWREGGTYRAAGHFVIGGLGGGGAGALASGGISLGADKLNSLQGELKDKLIELGMSPDTAQMFSQGAGMATAGTLGTAAGGTVGGGSAFNTDTNNRQLHPDERRKARELTAKAKAMGLTKPDGSAYTQEDIEEQMRLMGNAKTGEQPNTVTVLTNTAAIEKSLKDDPGMPKTAQGPAVMEVPGRANPELQSWIIDNTRDGFQYIPGQSPYSPSNAALNGPKLTTDVKVNTPTAKWANGDFNSAAGMPADKTGVAKVPDGSYGIGLYTPVGGGEIEVEIKNNEAVGGKVGIGAGVGGHLNLGTKKVEAGQLLGPVGGGKSEPLKETNPQNPATVRIGSSFTVGAGLGTVGTEASGAVGVEGSGNSTQTFKNFSAGNLTVSPVLPKVQGEIKVNVLEISVKAPEKTSDEPAK